VAALRPLAAGQSGSLGVMLGDRVNADEQAIRDLVAQWHRATAAGDVEAVLRLMAEDVVFLVAGQPPMRGRSSFEQGLRRLLASHNVESTGEVQEIETSGNLAYCWSMLNVRITSREGGSPMVRSGSALSILRKHADGQWLVIRDANLLAVAT
jgi:uncharacterized protein (TIGR02246 family)